MTTNHPQEKDSIMETCKHCGNQIYIERYSGEDFWIDNSGGDVCGVNGDNHPHDISPTTKGTDLTTIIFDRMEARTEAKRLSEFPRVSILWECEYEDDPTDREGWVQGIVIGFAIDANYDDCFLFRTINALDGGRFVVRCIPVQRIVGIRQ